MRIRSKGAVSPVLIFVIAVVAIAVLVAVFGKAVLETVAKRAEDRKAEKESTRELGKAVKGVLDGKELGASPNFPDTPIGRMQSITFEWLRREQGRHAELQASLTKAGWEWVGTPESLSTAANLKTCLERCKTAKGFVTAHKLGVEQGLQDMLKELDKAKGDTKEGREFLAGLKDSVSKPGNGFALGLKTWDLLKANIEALEESYRFLLARSGKYKVEPDGTITFNDSIPDKDRDQYNAIVDRINGSMEEVNRIEELRQKMAREKLGDLDRFTGTK